MTSVRNSSFLAYPPFDVPSLENMFEPLLLWLVLLQEWQHERREPGGGCTAATDGPRGAATTGARPGFQRLPAAAEVALAAHLCLCRSVFNVLPRQPKNKRAVCFQRWSRLVCVVSVLCFSPPVLSFPRLFVLTPSRHRLRDSRAVFSSRVAPA